MSMYSQYSYMNQKIIYTCREFHGHVWWWCFIMSARCLRMFKEHAVSSGSSSQSSQLLHLPFPKLLVGMTKTAENQSQTGRNTWWLKDAHFLSFLPINSWYPVDFSYPVILFRFIVMIGLLFKTDFANLRYRAPWAPCCSRRILECRRCPKDT